MRGPHGQLDASIPGKSKPLPTRVPANVYDAIKHAAEDDNRSMSDYIRVLLVTYLREHGYLPAKGA